MEKKKKKKNQKLWLPIAGSNCLIWMRETIAQETKIKQTRLSNWILDKLKPLVVLCLDLIHYSLLVFFQNIKLLEIMNTCLISV